MNMKRLILVLIALAVFPVCSDVTVSSYSDLPRIVASYQYINFAFGYRHWAMYIEKNGRLWWADYAEEDSIWQLLATTTIYTPEVFAKLLENADSLDDHIQPATLSWMLRSIPKIAREPLGDCTHSGNDMGSWVTTVYLAIGEERGKWITLEEWGDLTCANEHPLAAPLSDSIVSYEPSHHTD